MTISLAPEGIAGEGQHGAGTVLQEEPVSLGQGVTGEWLRDSEVRSAGGSVPCRAEGHKPKNPNQVAQRDNVGAQAPRRLQVQLDPGAQLVLPPHLWALLSSGRLQPHAPVWQQGSYLQPRYPLLPAPKC